jgi:hypothetical protein
MFNSALVGLNKIMAAIGVVSQVTNEQSLIDYTKAARVEPIVLIERDLAPFEATSDCLQTMLSLFAGFYLQAVSLHTNVNGVAVVGTLDKLNPNRDLTTAASSGNFLGMGTEEMQLRLPKPSKNFAAEAASSMNSNIKDINEAGNFSVGKMLNVSIKSEKGNDVEIPISVRLMTQLISTETLVHILTDGKEDTSFISRWDGWRSGRLEFINDIVFCRDLIDAHRKKLMLDHDNVFSDIIQRRRNNQKAMLLSGQVSVASASNMMIINSVTAARLENKISGRLKDVKVRKALFDETSLMLMAVIDNSFERVTIYYRGMNDFTNVSFRELKGAAKAKGGADISEILKAFMAGNGPSF